MNRITVSPIAYDGATYTLRVNYGCDVLPTSTILIMHAKSGDYDVTEVQDALPYSEGETASFTLLIFNLDSPLCTPTTYNFSSESEGSWPVYFSPESLYLVPGQNCSVSISVKIPQNTASGNYPVRIWGAASSGFLPTDHDIYLILNTTLGELECERQPPTTNLFLESIDGANVNYKLQIWNHDGFGCDATDFVVTVTLPSQFTWNHKEKLISLPPGKSEDVVLWFSLHHELYNKSFSVNVTSLSHDIITITNDMPPMSILPCIAHTPLIQILEQDLSMETRSADSVVVSVMNRDTLACDGSNFLFSVLDPPTDFARVTLYPTSVYLLPGQVAYFYMMVAVPIFQQQTYLSIPVGAERVLEGNYFDSTSYLTLSITPPPCVIAPLFVAAWCQGDDDLADGLIKCAGLINDDDSWNCPNINLRVHALVPPGWKADFLQGEIMQYNPDNYTWYWVNLTVPPNLLPGDYQYSFYGGEVQNETLHDFNTTYTLHTCHKSPLSLSPSSDSPPLLSQGQTVSLSLHIRNNNTVFCEGLLVVLAAELGKETAGLISVGFSKNTFTLGYNSDVDVDVTFTANQTGILPLNSSDTTRTYTFNLTATDKKNATYYMARVAMNLTVNLNCTFYPPFVVLSPLDNQLPVPGDYAEGTYTMSITNRDSPRCDATQFFASFSVPNGFDVPGGINAFLAPNETYVTNITFGISDNTPPGLYDITATANDRASVLHSFTSQPTNYTVGCPVPRPIFNLSAYQFTPFLHTKTAVQLTWNACENPVWCCCPCTWEIYRDGNKIGISSGSNYTDLDRPAGSSNNYTAITIDKRGIRSPTTTTCTVSVEVSVVPPDLTKLYFFIGLVIGSTMWVFGCVMLIVMFRKSLQDKIDRSPGDTALLLSENGEIREDEDDEASREAWTEADSRISSDDGDESSDAQ